MKFPLKQFPLPPSPLSCLLPKQSSIEKYSKIIYKLQQLRPSTHGNIHWRTAMTHIESPHRSQQIPEKCRRKNHIHNESITKVVKSKVVKSLRKFVPLKNQKEKQEKSQKWFQSKAAKKIRLKFYQFLLKFTAKMLKHGVDLLKEIPRRGRRTEKDQREADGRSSSSSSRSCSSGK